MDYTLSQFYIVLKWIAEWELYVNGTYFLLFLTSAYMLHAWDWSIPRVLLTLFDWPCLSSCIVSYRMLMFLITKSLHKEKEQLSIPSNMNQHKEKRGTSAWKVYGFLLQKMMQKCATRRMYPYKTSSFAAWDGYPKKVHSLVGFSTYIPRWWFKSVFLPTHLLKYWLGLYNTSL